MSKNDFEDDGRVVSDMSLTENKSWYQNFRAKTDVKNNGLRNSSEQPIEMTKKEERQFILSAIGAALTIGGVFLGVFFVFIWFCVNIWFQ